MGRQECVSRVRIQALMSIKSIAGEALEALRFNRQRSVLTMISLAWGVACFVILYSYGEGFLAAGVQRPGLRAFRQWDRI